MTWSTTIQCGERILLTPLFRVQVSVLCPLSAYDLMCKKVKINPEDPLLSLPPKKYVTYSIFQNRLKEVILKLNLNPDTVLEEGEQGVLLTLVYPPT